MSGLDASLQKMRNAGMPDIALKTFARYYERLRDGDAGLLPESALEPSTSSPPPTTCRATRRRRARRWSARSS